MTRRGCKRGGFDAGALRDRSCSIGTWLAGVRMMHADVPIRDMTDDEIDPLMPAEARRVSRMYWTSAAVARRVAEILTDLRARRVLDVGSGSGKFCVVAGAHAPGISFVGVEHRPHLVAVARSLSAAVGTANVSFVVGDATQVSWAGFDAFYVYNPFAENIFAVDDRLDDKVELSRSRHIADVTRVAARLGVAAAGSVLITYHGLCGPIPDCYELVAVEEAGSGLLRVWGKTVAGPHDGARYWIEDGAEIGIWKASECPQVFSQTSR